MSKTITLNREHTFINECLGHLYYGSEVVATLENTKKMIPKGTYKVTLTWSPKFKRKLPLLSNVPGRRGIRIHPGNFYEDSSGCILLGVRCQIRALYKSQTCVNNFIDWLSKQNEDIYITIV